jgi:hypothetical protein
VYVAGKFRKPYGDFGRIVIDNVVNSARWMLKRYARCIRGVIHVNKRPNAGPVADQGQFAFAYELNRGAVQRERGSGSIETAVTQNDAGEPVRACHKAFKLLNCGDCRRHVFGRGWVERVVFSLDSAAFAAVGPACIALRDKRMDTYIARCREKVFRTFGAKPVCSCQSRFEIPEVTHRLERGHLMHDYVRAGFHNRLLDRFPVQPVH